MCSLLLFYTMQEYSVLLVLVSVPIDAIINRANISQLSVL